MVYVPRLPATQLLKMFTFQGHPPKKSLAAALQLRSCVRMYVPSYPLVKLSI